MGTFQTQTLAAVPLFGHTKILPTLIEMGSAALAAAAVPYRVRRPEFPARDKNYYHPYYYYYYYYY